MSELDLIKFIRQQRLHALALLTLLSSRQHYIMSQISRPMVRDSSDHNEHALSGHDFDDDSLDLDKLIKQTFKSDSSREQRLSRLIKVINRSSNTIQEDAKEEEEEFKAVETVIPLYRRRFKFPPI